MRRASQQGGVSSGVVRVVVATGFSSTLAVLPISLLGALAPLMRLEGELGNARLGAAVAMFFATAAATSILGGRLAERFGGGAVMTSATTISATTLPLLALTADRTAGLFIVMGIAGIGNAVAQTAGNVALAEHVEQRVRGLSFGVKLAAIPLAGLLAGLSVPMLGVPLGWRPAMAAGALLLIPYMVAIPGGLSGGHYYRATVQPRQRIALPWVLMGTTAALGSAAGNSMQVFFVSSSVGKGIDAGTAGLLLALGGSIGIAGRVLWGWIGARPGMRPRPLVAILFVVGGISFIGIGLATTVTSLAVATAFAFATGWSWAGLLLYLVVETSPEQPGAATGLVLTGVWLGGIAGPPVFGGLVEWHSFLAAWTLMGVFLVVGGLLALLHRPRPSWSRSRH